MFFILTSEAIYKITADERERVLMHWDKLKTKKPNSDLAKSPGQKYWRLMAMWSCEEPKLIVR